MPSTEAAENQQHQANKGKGTTQKETNGGGVIPKKSRYGTLINGFTKMAGVNNLRISVGRTRDILIRRISDHTGHGDHLPVR